MSTNATPSQEGTDGRSIDTLDERDARALTEYMSVLEDVAEARGAPGIYRVVGQHGATYTVDVRTDACSCEDATYTQPEGGCKHYRRVLFATGERAIPAWVDRDAVDDQLGEHVSGEPRVAATDGGVITDAAGSNDADRADQDDGARAAAPREYTRGYYEPGSRFDNRFAADPPVRNGASDD